VLDVLGSIGHCECDEPIELSEVCGDTLLGLLLEREELADGGNEPCCVLSHKLSALNRWKEIIIHQLLDCAERLLDVLLVLKVLDCQ